MSELIDGRYQVLDELGRGGMGSVLRVRDTVSGRELALKLLLQRRASPAQRERFLREARVTAALRHPGIVTLHACGEHEGVPYLLYELLPGCRGLEEAFQGRPLRERAGLVRDAARALGHAHRAGVVHRDVKPENLLVDEAGRLRVADFGLALAEGEDRLTRTGGLVGTPAYMAPEQIASGRQETPATDVWALGVILYQALTGRQPFEAEHLPGLAAQILQREPAWPGELARDVPPALDAICRRALAKDPAQRPPDGEALAEELDLFLSGATPLAAGARRRAPALQVAFGALALGSGLAAALAVGGRGPGEGPAPAGSPAGLGTEAPALPAWFRALPAAERPTSAAGLVPTAGEGEYLHARDGSRLVWVPPGRFRMGADVEEGAATGCSPARVVTLRRGYYIGRHEVTWAQYLRFCREAGHPQPPAAAPDLSAYSEAPPDDPTVPLPRTDDVPVYLVTWQDAGDYCRWAGLRLPTEAEWERAARGQDGRRYPWGDEPSQERVNGRRDRLQGAPERFLGPLPVGSFPLGVSPAGCLDMAGNVGEWVEDWFAPYDPRDVIDPLQRQGVGRVARGGGWSTKHQNCRATRRDMFGSQVLSTALGFRVARGE